MGFGPNATMELTFTINFGFIPEPDWRAVYCVAYLARFERLA
jgi:hypothetical protein